MSRFRNPMSKSTTHVLCPRWAKPVAKEAADVVFPTPPFPEVIQIMRPRDGESLVSTSDGWESTNGCSCEEDEEANCLVCCIDFLSVAVGIIVGGRKQLCEAMCPTPTLPQAALLRATFDIAAREHKREEWRRIGEMEAESVIFIGGLLGFCEIP